MPTPPLIQSLWVGNELSTMEKLSISSFLQNGHPFHLYVYDEVKNIPKGVELRDASEILHPSRIFKYKNRATYAGFSDMFRYKLLHEGGGYWVDTDIVCLATFQDESDHLFCSEKAYRAFLPWQKRDHISSCVIRSPKGSAVMEYCYHEAINCDPMEIKFGDIGPKLVSRAVQRFDMTNNVAKWEIFCPIHWWQWEKLINSSSRINIEQWMEQGTLAIHLWNEMWRMNNIDKDASFPTDSLYEQFKQRYLES